VADSPELFLSYSREDARDVERLASALQAAGYQCWWDRDLASGVHYLSETEAKLKAAKAVVVLWSKTSITSHWVADEAAAGRDDGRLAALSFDGSMPPLGFRQFQVTDFSGWKGGTDEAPFRSLLKGLERIVPGAVAAPAADPVPPRAAVSSPTPPRIDRRMLLIGGAGAAAAAAVGGVVWLRSSGGSAKASSVAVLPFANLSSDAEQAYFADGLATEIRAALARNAALQVAAPTSSRAFRDHEEDAQTVGRKLGVAYLLEGSVQRSGTDVRVVAELTDARSGFSAWAQTFQRKIDDILVVQGEIAGAVAGALAVKMAPGSSVGGTTVVAAYDAYLLGQALFLSDAGEEADRKALAQFDTALAADPLYALAHAARSRTLAAMATLYAPADQLRSTFDAAIASAERAVSLAPELAAAQLALGFARGNGRLDVAGARSAYDRAAQLGAGDADVLVLCAYYYANDGRDAEAKAAIERAVVLDPVNARVLRAAGIVDYAARRYAEAIRHWRRALEMNPKLSEANAKSAYALTLTGRHAEAREALLKEPNAMVRLAGLAIVERRLGDDTAARKARDELEREHGESATYQQAQIAAQWGLTDQALAALERAHAIGDAGMLALKTDPFLDSVRASPRFGALLKAMRFS
jgi:TolB-like protein/Tfp pilus assembly protein PilF